MTTVLSNETRELIDKLRSFKADNYVQLPQIAVMGDTSSGKSSVLSALSGIQFPSSDKLCTRCPTQLVLKKAETFKGRVHIQRFESKSNQSEEEPGESPPITSYEEITTAIEDMTEIIMQDMGGGSLISDDSIVIQVEGPEVPDLTLIDLPGLIRAVGDNEDQAIIGQVRALVNRFLNQERTIILAVIPSNVDMHNTEILQASKAADPDGNRTIGVLTKLDLVDKGAEDSVIELLENRTKTLKLGYHAVRCRGQQDLKDKVSIETGLQGESHFFKSHDSWSSVSKDLVGTEKLKLKLANLLESHINKSMPSVGREIRSELEKCTSALKALGPSLNNPSERRRISEETIRSVLATFTNACNGTYGDEFFQNHIVNGAFDPRLRAIFSTYERQFRDEISSTRIGCRGDLRVGDKVFWYRNGVDQYELFIINVSSDGSSFTGKYTDEDGGIIEWEITPLEMKNIVYPTEEMENRLNANRSDQLPIFPNYNIFIRLVTDVCIPWETEMNEMATKTKALLKQFVEELLKDQFPDFDYFRESVHCRIKDFMDKCFDRMQVAMKEEHKLESHYPSTLNHYLYENLMKLRFDPAKKALETMADNERNVNLDAALGVLNSFGVGFNSNEKQEAIEMQYALAAYVKVAQKRFIDAIPRIIKRELWMPITNNLIKELYFTDQELATLLNESNEIVKLRAELEKKKESLEMAKQVLLL